MKKVLIACEESQAVTIEMRNLGIEAFSCDIEPCSGNRPEWHIQGDVLPLLKEEWDMVIAFPPCTHLAVSGAHLFPAKRADGRQQQGIDFFMEFTKLKCKYAIENPVGIMSTLWRKPNQIIQPWQFGENASKKTCLWLNGLPKLTPTGIFPPGNFGIVVFADDLPVCDGCGDPWCDLHDTHYSDCSCYGPTDDSLRYVTIGGYMFACKKDEYRKPVWENQTPGGQNKLGPSTDRAKIRSKTPPGIAKAMANQWGQCILND
jgi:hypothetical protein